MSMFYDVDRVLSTGASLIMVSAKRGGGKTYGMLKRAVENCLEDPDFFFFYMRRYKTELKTALPTIFDPFIANDEFPDVEFAVKGEKLYINGEWRGMGLCLTSAIKYKSMSFPQPKKMVIFDEFLMTRNSGSHYIGGNEEPSLLLNVADSLFRNDMPDSGSVIVCISNTPSKSNPYYNYFGIRKFYDGEVHLYNNGSLALDLPDLEAFTQFRKEKTIIGSISEGTPYASFAIEGEWIEDDDTFCIGEKKPKGYDRIYLAFLVEGKIMSFWSSKKGDFIYCTTSHKIPDGFGLRVISGKDMTLDSTWSSRSADEQITVRLFYSAGKMRFDTVQTKNMFLEYLC